MSGTEWATTIHIGTDLELTSDQEMSTTQGQRHGHSKNYKLNLSGNERKVFDGFGGTCQSTGRLESEVHALIDSA
jgi:hypothetical protein